MKKLLIRKTKIIVLLLFALLNTSVSQETYEIPYPENYENNFCKESTIGFSQVIQCESSSTFYAQLVLNPSSLQDIEISYMLDGEEYIINSENGELIIMNLPVGVNITLRTTNSCNELYDLIIFNTSLNQSPKEQVLISQEMAHLLNPWGDEDNQSEIPGGDESESIYNLVYNTERVGKHEKIAFVQQFYYKFNPIPDVYCGEIPPPPNPLDENTCICNWVISSFTSAFPTNLNNTTGGMNETFRSYGIDDGNGVDGGGWEGNAGPAHGRYHYLDSWKKHKGNYHEVRAGDLFIPGTTDSELSSNYVRIFYKLLCEGITVPPSDCDCEKSLIVGWHYNAYLNAKAHLLNGGGNKSSKAMVDEVAIVMAEVQGEGAQMLDHGSASARAACNETFNGELLTSAGQIFAGAAMIAIGGWSALGNSGSIASTVNNSTGTQGTSTSTTVTTNTGTSVVTTTPNNSINLSASNGNLINSGISMLSSGIAGTISGFAEGWYTGECSNQSGTSVLVDGSKLFLIQPNKGVELTLSSFTTSAVGGKWKYQSSTYVASEFFLGAKIPDNIQTVDSECCSPAVGTYISSSWRDAPGSPEYNNNQYLTEVTEFFAQEPVWSQSNFNIAREWDNLIGPAPTVCDQNTGTYQGLIGSPQSDDAFGKANVNRVSGGIQINQFDAFDHEEKSKLLKYQIYDVNGRLMNSGDLEFLGSELFISTFDIFGASKMPVTGLYFLYINNGKRQQVLKFIY